jgi:hypothetical protein
MSICPYTLGKLDQQKWGKSRGKSEVLNIPNLLVYVGRNNQRVAVVYYTHVQEKYVEPENRWDVKLDITAHTYNSSKREAEARGSWVQGKHGLINETLSWNKRWDGKIHDNLSKTIRLKLFIIFFCLKEDLSKDKSKNYKDFWEL